ncbi:hypothetical protein CF335_g9051 [Tilletia laevis]|nr:hypothetical protein CF335_g9051 [Tilletia laevis]
MSANNAEDPPALAASLRCLERLPDAQRPLVEQAIRAQFDADQQASQAAAAQEAEEEANRLDLERQEIEADEIRRAAAAKEQEAQLAAAKNLIDLAKAHDLPSEGKGKGRQVIQDDAMSNDLDILVATPSQKIRDRIRACEYIDLWHLTAEGMAAATKSKISGDTSFELGSDGTFKIKDSVTGFRPDQDLSMPSWVTANGHYVRLMQDEGVPENIIQSMIRLNHLLTNHPDFERHGQAIRMWHQHQRRQWVISGHLNTDGVRFNLGKPNQNHYDAIRLRLLEERAERRLAPVKRTSSDDHAPSADGGGSRPKVARVERTPFRCFVCFSSAAGHPFTTCAAKERVDGKHQHVTRGASGRPVFADSLKPICINYQIKGCTGTCRTGGVHRCANCGIGGHGCTKLDKLY